MATPFTRENWNDIIQKVNALAESPDPGCPGLDPLPEVDPDHIWTKDDIQVVRDKLLEICPDNEFTAEKEMWKQDIVDEINDAIALGWCNCACDNAAGAVVTYLATINQTACDPSGSEPEVCHPSYVASGTSAANKMQDWGPVWAVYCDLEAAVTQLENEIAALEEGDEKAAKQAELVALKAERDAKLEEANALEAEAETFAAQSVLDAYCPPNGQVFDFLTVPQNTPWSNTACGEITGDDPTACLVTWAIDVRMTKVWHFGTTEVGPWTRAATGAYLKSGTPFFTYIAYYSGITTYACSGGCDWEPPCDGDSWIAEVRFTQTFPDEV